MAWIELPDGRRYVLKGNTVTIGRDAGNELVLPGDLKVSRTHAELRLSDGQWFLIDLGSSNGSNVNRRRIEQHPLRDGDRIQLGRTTMVYVGGEDPNATEADTSTRAKLPELSGRERQVLALIARGRTDREIGDELFISTSTVRSHLDRISEKTGLRRRTELTRLAVEFGMVD